MSMGQSLGLSKRGYEAIGSQKLDLKPGTKEGFYVGGLRWRRLIPRRGGGEGKSVRRRGQLPLPI